MKDPKAGTPADATNTAGTGSWANAAMNNAADASPHTSSARAPEATDTASTPGSTDAAHTAGSRADTHSASDAAASAHSPRTTETASTEALHVETLNAETQKAVEQGRGQEPKASPTARWVSILSGCALIALGAVAGRELWIHYSTNSSQRSWIEPLFDSLAKGTFQNWMIPASIAAVILGLLLLIVVFKPRSRTHLPLDSQVSLWARPVDVARLTTATAKRVPGVSTASTTVRRSTITLNAEIISDEPTQTEWRLRESVEEQLRPLIGSQMNIKMKVQNTGGDSA